MSRSSRRPAPLRRQPSGCLVQAIFLLFFLGAFAAAGLALTAWADDGAPHAQLPAGASRPADPPACGNGCV